MSTIFQFHELSYIIVRNFNFRTQNLLVVVSKNIFKLHFIYSRLYKCCCVGLRECYGVIKSKSSFWFLLAQLPRFGALYMQSSGRWLILSELRSFVSGRGLYTSNVVPQTQFQDLWLVIGSVIGVISNFYILFLVLAMAGSYVIGRC